MRHECPGDPEVTSTIEHLQAWLNAKEDEHLEFKEAKTHFDFEEAVKYCVALANELGGTILFGITDKRPRRVVGTLAFKDLEQTRAGLTERLRLRIQTSLFEHPNGRVVAIHVPARPIGVPISYKGAYWMRAGESLVPMTNDQLKRIFDEVGPDFSAEICKHANVADLDPVAIAAFRERFIRKSGNGNLLRQSDPHLLGDADLIVGDKVTYAALILLGTAASLTRHLGQAEVIFEYRSSDASIEMQKRVEFRRGFLSFYDELWGQISNWNEVQHFQDGLFVWDVKTFNEGVVREAILNAVCHRTIVSEGPCLSGSFLGRSRLLARVGFHQALRRRIFWNASFRGIVVSRRRWAGAALWSDRAKGLTGCFAHPSAKGSLSRNIPSPICTRWC
jgi:ATP-dependent DNA helicase RecG